MAARRTWIIALTAVGAAGTGTVAGWHGRPASVAVPAAVTGNSPTTAAPAGEDLQARVAELDAEQSGLAGAIAAAEAQQASEETVTTAAPAPPPPAPPAPGPTSSGTPTAAAPAPASTPAPPPVHSTTGASSTTQAGEGSDQHESEGPTGSGDDGSNSAGTAMPTATTGGDGGLDG